MLYFSVEMRDSPTFPGEIREMQKYCEESKKIQEKSLNIKQIYLFWGQNNPVGGYFNTIIPV